MKRGSLILVVVCSTLVLAGSAAAEPVSIFKNFETDKKFGIGLALGVPTSVSGKYLLTSAVALDFGVGGYYRYRDRDGLHLHGDLLWHPFLAVEGETFRAPFYVGIGGRVLNYDDITHLGFRFPVGVAFDFNDSHFDVFLESAFVIDASVGEGGGGKYDFNGLVGARYFL